MKMLVVRILGLVVLAGVVLFGVVDIDESSAETSDSAEIVSFDADFTVSSTGTLTAVETLTFNFPVSKHGIFRLLDTRDQNNAKNRLMPYDITVRRDGRKEPFEVLKQNRGRYRTIKIGDADKQIYGRHTYRIAYKIDGVLTPGTNGAPTQFYWNVIGVGWLNTIEAYDLRVHLPADTTNVRCTVGVGRGQACNAGSGRDLQITSAPGAAQLRPNTPVTIQAPLAISTPEADTRPWNSDLDPILGTSPGLLTGVGVLAVLVTLGGFALSRSVGEKAPPYPLMYAPPEGIGPAQAAYILTEKVETKAFVATMMYAAEKGAVNMGTDGGGWNLSATDKQDAWGQTDEVTQRTASALGVVGQGGSFQAAPGSVAAGKKLKSVLSGFEANTEGWAKTNGLMITSGLGGFGGFVILASAGLAVFAGAVNLQNMSILAIIPGLFAISALGVGASGAGTRRTAAGRDLWSRVGGFHRILSTPSAQDRFDFAGRKDLYTAYLPWAIAFDCADEWAKKYRVETGAEPPTPSYFPAYAGAHTGAYVNQVVSSFDSAVSSAISSYEATQSSSSSGGGGGFSGGGGGGGGGGGSW